MKLFKKLNSHGFSHGMMLLLFMVIFAIIGVAYLVFSHASSLPTTAEGEANYYGSGNRNFPTSTKFVTYDGKICVNTQFKTYSGLPGVKTTYHWTLQVYRNNKWTDHVASKEYQANGGNGDNQCLSVTNGESYRVVFKANNYGNVNSIEGTYSASGGGHKPTIPPTAKPAQPVTPQSNGGSKPSAPAPQTATIQGIKRGGGKTMSIERQGNGGKRDYIDVNGDGSFFFKNLQVPGTYYVRVDTGGANVKWDACANNTTCHSGTPQDQGNTDTATIVLNSAGYIDMRWNISAPSQPVTNGRDLLGNASGRCLDIVGGNGNEGARVQLWDCNSNPQQKWLANSDGTITGLNNRCLDGDSNNTGNGAMVRMYNCNGGQQQKWTINSNGSICNQLSGRCLDATGPSNDNGTLIQLYDYLSGSNQQWHFR